MSVYSPAGSLVPRVPTRDMMSQHRPEALPLLYLWTYLNLVSNSILLPILVFTFIFTKAKRDWTLINVCITWILSGIYSLLLFFGGVSKPFDPQPSRALCVAQTSLMYGIMPMWAVAILVLMYHLVVVVSGNANTVGGRLKMFFMLASPYIVEFGFSLAALIISLTSSPDLVKRSNGFFYCGLHSPPLFSTMAIFTFTMCLGINALEIQLAILLYRNWRGLKDAGHRMHFELQVVLRVFVFGAYIFFGMVANVVRLFDGRSLLPDMYVATIGTVILLVFGTQADVFRVWCFWRRDPLPCPLHSPPRPRTTTSLGPPLDLNRSRSASTLGFDPVPVTQPSKALARNYNKGRGSSMNGYQRV